MPSLMRMWLCTDPAGQRVSWVPWGGTTDYKALVYDEYQWIPKSGFLETWQVADATGVIDPALWTPTNPATGAAWAVDAVWVPHLMLRTIPNANETARLLGNHRWLVMPDTGYAANTFVQRLHMMFELRLANVANLDNTLTILGGFTAGGMAMRNTDNIVVFGLVGDALQTITDTGGLEETNTGFGETLTNHNKFEIVCEVDQILFYLNGTLIATHDTDIPDIPMFPNFFFDTEAGGAATIGMGQVTVWTEVSIG